MLPALQAMNAVIGFSLNSLRGRLSQALPVTLALLLLIGTALATGALHTVSSALTRQQIAAHWRGSADLLVRPSASVSQPERDAGWINPASVLDSYGGISAQQLASIASLPQVAQMLPFASIGWRRIDVITPVVLQQQGLYRVTALWMGAPRWANNAASYILVSDLASLTDDEPLTQPVVQRLVLPANAQSVIYPMSLPALQLLVGVASAQEPVVQSLLLQSSNTILPTHVTIHVDRLNSQMSMLSSCIAPSAPSSCWQSVTTQAQRVSYQVQNLQLLRYSQPAYSATAQQIAAGQLTINALGQDSLAPVYRTLLQQHLTFPDNELSGSIMDTQQQDAVLPFDEPAYMPFLPDALQFLPLAQGCLVNGKQCYSGLFIRLRNVDHYSAKSLSILQATAAAITARTGLHVDILDGSSTRAITLVSNPSGSTLTTTWRVVGVAIQITHGVDALQNTLFVLCALICLLALGSAGTLIGIGSRKEAQVLEQLGWSISLGISVYITNALLLMLPGCLLSSILIALSNRFWPGNISPATMWALLAIGMFTFVISLVYLACGLHISPRRKFRGEGEDFNMKKSVQPSVGLGARDNMGMGLLWLPMSLRNIKFSSAFYTRITAPLACGFAIAAMIFLIAIEYLMISGLNRELVVTTLGSQVSIALEGTQLLLILLVVATAFLTIGLCTSLLLRGRRDELALLAKIGWERQHVLLRLLKESWLTAALSSEIGVLFALGIVIVAGSLPPLWVIVSVLSGGPMLGIMLISLIACILVWRELNSVYLK